MKKPVIHFEIGCDNLAETAEFYKEVFNWSITINNNSASINTEVENGIPGHITELGHDPRNYITFYIETDTIEEDLELINSKGGKNMIGPLALADGRVFAWFQDIAGNTIGLISPVK